MYDRLRLGAVLLLIGSLAGCLPAITPTPHNTPAVLVVQRTAALAPLDNQSGECINELPGTGLVLQEAPAGALEAQPGSLALRWGSGPALEGFAAVVGQEALALIVHPQNPVEALAVDDLRRIYRGEMTIWPQPAGGEIQAWAYPETEDIQQNFLQSVLDGEALDESMLYLAPGPMEMIEAVAQAPEAVGFIPRRWLTEQVKTVPVSGLPAERLLFPVLAISPEEPRGLARAWLLCLQEAVE